MSRFNKAREIIRTHGLAGLIKRASLRLSRDIRGRGEARVQHTAWRSLVAQAKTGPVYFPRHDDPLVSLIIPVYNNVTLTAMCLNSILRELATLPIEVIVVDDGSTDGTEAYLESCSGIRVLRHVENHGVVQSMNDGARAAAGRYLHFLNNDTIVTPGWLRPMVRTFEQFSDVGAVGSQLRKPDGTLSEAGGVVWRDGSAANYGRGHAPRDPRFCFPREVDYCSAASLMVRADVFWKVGGFSHAYSPAYYEDVDLCFGIRAAGHRVFYQPDSVVIHFEGATCGTSTHAGVKQYQEINRATFAANWRDELAQHFPPDDHLTERAARRIAGERTALVIDSFIPFDDRSAGGRRTLAIMKLMREIGWHVIFLSDDGGAYEPYASRARALGIEVVPHRGDAASVIRSLPVPLDLAWVSRPDVLQKYLPVLRAHTAAAVVYDTVDLHYLRLQREQTVTGKATNWEAVHATELDLARRVEHTVVTSAYERRVLGEANVDASVIPILETPVRTYAPFSARTDLLFLGNYTHEPNVDAAAWLCSDIMPRVWERLPHVRLLLVGSDPTPAIERLGSDRVVVTGFVEDLRPLFDSARVGVAPLRFGAGMKGKVVQSIAHALPVVTTAIGAEGIGLDDGCSALIRDDAHGFADAIVALYNDSRLWTEISEGAFKAAQSFAPQAEKKSLERVLDAALRQQVGVRVDVGSAAHSA